MLSARDNGGARIGTAFAEFLRAETSGAVVLLAATVLALVLANSPGHAWLESLGHVEIGVRLGQWGFADSLKHWVDDALMAIFFFVVGLEIKRELVAGELSSPRRAALPAIAALGGMVVPAALYLALNAGGPGMRGWGIPMATDIAFALGVLALLGTRVPTGLKVFLVALAIVDDIGAVLVIALFYTSGISVPALLVAVVLLAVLVILGRAGVDRLWPYLAVGVLVWFAVLVSGVHATIAGVLVAFTIPTRPSLSPREFVSFGRDKLAQLEAGHVPHEHPLTTDVDQECAMEIRRAATSSAPLLWRLETALHPFTTFVVLPLFALFNAGVRFVGEDTALRFTSPVALGIAAGLLVGKPVGILGASWLSCRLGMCTLPNGVAWRQVAGVSVLAGIGFTMSLFVTNLAFPAMGLQAAAKLAILVSSTVAGLVGYVVTRRMTIPEAAPTREV